MKTIPVFPVSFSFARLLRYALIVLGTAWLAGCALIPDLENRAAMKPLESYQTNESLKGEGRAWPQEKWWTAYGDVQLDGMMEEALANSPNMTIAEARLNRAIAMAQLAGATLLPSVDANTAVSMDKQSYRHMMGKSAPHGWRDYGQISLDFQWEIDFWGKNRAALKAATSAAEAADAEKAEARLVLTTSIAAEYGELARLYAAHNTTTAAIRARQTNVELFHNRFKEGMETLASVRQEEARLATSEQELLALEENMTIQRNRLAALMGAGPDRGLAIARPALDVKRGFALPKEMQLALLGRRPDIVAARKRVESAASTIDQRKAAFYPNVNLVAFIGVQSMGLNNLFRSGADFGSIGPAISLPIFDGGRLRAQLFVAQADLDEAIGNYNLTVTQALEQVADAASSQKSLEQQLIKAKAAVDAAQEAHRIVSNRYSGGLSNYLEVLVAEQTLLANQRVQSDLQSRAFTLDVALIRALGGGYVTQSDTSPSENKK